LGADKRTRIIPGSTLEHQEELVIGSAYEILPGKTPEKHKLFRDFIFWYNTLTPYITSQGFTIFIHQRSVTSCSLINACAGYYLPLTVGCRKFAIHADRQSAIWVVAGKET
jgi:hypothetical protein